MRKIWSNFLAATTRDWLCRAQATMYLCFTHYVNDIHHMEGTTIVSQSLLLTLTGCVATTKRAIAFFCLIRNRAAWMNCKFACLHVNWKRETRACTPTDENVYMIPSMVQILSFHFWFHDPHRLSLSSWYSRIWIDWIVKFSQFEN